MTRNDAMTKSEAFVKLYHAKKHLRDAFMADKISTFEYYEAIVVIRSALAQFQNIPVLVSGEWKEANPQQAENRMNRK